LRLFSDARRRRPARARAPVLTARGLCCRGPSAAGRRRQGAGSDRCRWRAAVLAWGPAPPQPAWSKGDFRTDRGAN